MQLLESIQPHLDTVLKRILDSYRKRSERLLLEGLVSQLPVATVQLDWLLIH